jgi:CheY-like chemotaxis protein
MASRPVKSRKVLILDDEPFIAMMLEEELATMGVQVVGPVNNLGSALLLAETSDLDGALLDLNINGAFVTEVADKLRIRGVPFVFVTGYDRPPGLRYRDVVLLRKPFSETELRFALIAMWE